MFRLHHNNINYQQTVYLKNDDDYIKTSYLQKEEFMFGS